MAAAGRPAEVPPAASDASSVAAVAGCTRFTSMSSGLELACCPGKAAETPSPKSAWLMMAAGTY